MKISELEIKRFITAYKIYKDNNDVLQNWQTNRTYLENNGLYSILEILETLYEYPINQIVKILEILGIDIE